MGWHRTKAPNAQSILATGMNPVDFDSHGSSLTEGGYFTVPDASGREAQQTTIRGTIPGPIIQARVKLANPLVLDFAPYDEGQHSTWGQLRQMAGGSTAIREEQLRIWKEDLNFSTPKPPPETWAMRNLLKAKGFDGIVYREPPGTGDQSGMWGSQAVVFDSDDPAKVMWEAPAPLASTVTGPAAASPRKANLFQYLEHGVRKQRGRGGQGVELVDWDTFIARIQPAGEMHEPVVKLLPISKGEGAGHAFRGNQWTGGIAGPQQAGTPTVAAPTTPQSPSDIPTRAPYPERDTDPLADLEHSYKKPASEVKVGEWLANEGPVVEIKSGISGARSMSFTHVNGAISYHDPDDTVFLVKPDPDQQGRIADANAVQAARDVTRSVHETGGINWKGEQVESLGPASWSSPSAVQTKIDINARLVDRLARELDSDPKFGAWANARVKELKLDVGDKARQTWGAIVGIDQDATDELDKKNLLAYHAEYDAWKAKISDRVDALEQVLHAGDLYGSIASMKRSVIAVDNAHPGIDDVKEVVDLPGLQMLMSKPNELHTTVGPHLSEARDVRVGDEVRESYNADGTWVVGKIEPKPDDPAGRIWLYDTDGAKRLLLNKSDTITVSDPEYGKFGWGQIVTSLSAEEAVARLNAIGPVPPGPGERGPNTVPRLPMPSDVRLVALASKIRNNIDTWAGSSGDSRVTSIALQRGVAEHFHLDPSYVQPLEGFASKSSLSVFATDDDPDAKPYVWSSELRRTNAPEALANDLKIGDKIIDPYDDATITISDITASGTYPDKKITLFGQETHGFPINTYVGVPADTVVKLAPLGDANSPWNVAGRMLDAERPFYEHFAQAVYDATQNELQRRGVKELYLYRGMHLDDADAIPKWANPPVSSYRRVSTQGMQGDPPHDDYVLRLKQSAVRPVTMQPLSSWSSDEETANNFGNYGSGNDIHLTAVVPAGRVFSLASGTGVGSLSEREVVVFGGKGEVRVHWAHSDDRKTVEQSELADYDMSHAKDTTEADNAAMANTKTYVPQKVKVSDLKPGMKLTNSLYVHHIATKADGMVAVYIAATNDAGTQKTSVLGPYPADHEFNVDPASIPTTTSVKVKDLKPGMMFDGKTITNVESSTAGDAADPTYMVGYDTPGLGPSQGLYGANGVFDIDTVSIAKPAVAPSKYVAGPNDPYITVGGSDIPSDDKTLHSYMISDLMVGDTLPYHGKITTVVNHGTMVSFHYLSPVDHQEHVTAFPKVQLLDEIPLPDKTPLVKAADTIEPLYIDAPLYNADWIKFRSRDVSSDGTAIIPAVHKLGAHNELHSTFIPTIIPVDPFAKGESAGHPFRGNQWVSGQSGSDRQPFDANDAPRLFPISNLPIGKNPAVAAGDAAWKDASDKWVGSNGYETADPGAREDAARKVRELGAAKLREVAAPGTSITLGRMSPKGVIDLVHNFTAFADTYPDVVKNVSKIRMVSNITEGTTGTAWVEPDYDSPSLKFTLNFASQDFGASIWPGASPDAQYNDLLTAIRMSYYEQHSLATNVGDVMWHEFGHLIHNTALKNALVDRYGTTDTDTLLPKMREAFRDPNHMSLYQHDRLMKAFRQVSRGKSHISKYGASDGWPEAFGELVAAQHNGQLDSVVMHYPASRQKSIRNALRLVETYAATKPDHMHDLVAKAAPSRPGDDVLQTCRGYHFRQFAAVAKGESAGHAFRGNQYVDGTSGGTDVASDATSDAAPIKTTALIKAAIDSGGFTWHPGGPGGPGGTVPDHGYVVATGEPSLNVPLTEPVNNTQRKALRQAILQYLNDHADEFAQNPQLHLGGWWDKEDGQFVLDRVEVIDDRDQATTLGKQRNQKAIWDIGAGAEIDTGGTGGYEQSEQLRKQAPPWSSARGPGRARAVGGPDARRTARPRFFGRD